jgi:release factor glutamine methyltransferase
VEISADALLLAERNLRTHGAFPGWTLHGGSWWEPLRPWWGAFDLVLSNPPYIPSNLIRGLEPVVRDHEPHLALSGGADGLDSIRAVVKDAPRALAPGGWLLIEHHHDQSAAVVAMMQSVGLSDVAAAPDLQGVLRFGMGRRPF